ncbi:MAG: copper-binding protein [Sulfurimicrobium sp.]|nr:copper-binding protein [Sulfurimicrobium sp.]MDP2199308.1 copper-binding protein [Sulfurimicrobium sp.]
MDDIIIKEDIMKKALNTFIAAFAMLAAATSIHAAEVAYGKGTVNQINADAGSVNISHEAIPALKWPAMTMDIKTADKKILNGVKPGQAVSFGLIKDPKAGYVISHIESIK